MDPASTAGEHFTERLDTLLHFITDQEGVRLPGDRRIALEAAAQAKGAIDLPDALLAQLNSLS